MFKVIVDLNILRNRTKVSDIQKHIFSARSYYPIENKHYGRSYYSDRYCCCHLTIFLFWLQMFLMICMLFLIVISLVCIIAVNYVAVSEALGVSPSVLAAGFAVDNVLCAVYFTLIFALASKIPPEDSQTNFGVYMFL